MAVYTISAEIRFSSSHALRGYGGDCERVHGHNWIARVYYEFERLDGLGLTVDYRELKASLEREVLVRFDHRHLNEVPPFDRINPTSENIAAYIFALCRDHVRFEDGTLREVEVWETSTDMVRYRE
ncbi:MAG TPA: 6-carboxytetrahydropterin synthase [Patescibacteria group bacterium]|nr:6-carboxytetrahydropterin synthase [Patescibacteria group bacterium]